MLKRRTTQISKEKCRKSRISHEILVFLTSFVRLPADPHPRNILFVERLGKAHRLSAIRVKEMELVFDSDAQVAHTSDANRGGPRSCC
jgi:hypothetical protein